VEGAIVPTCLLTGAGRVGQPQPVVVRTASLSPERPDRAADEGGQPCLVGVEEGTSESGRGWPGSSSTPVSTAGGR
jgi:hypothetical protein